MGARYAPRFANTFFNRWEQKEIVSKEWHQLKMYRRFIDDIYLIWEGGQEELQTFLNHLVHLNE